MTWFCGHSSHLLLVVGVYHWPCWSLLLGPKHKGPRASDKCEMIIIIIIFIMTIKQWSLIQRIQYEAVWPLMMRVISRGTGLLTPGFHLFTLCSAVRQQSSAASYFRRMLEQSTTVQIVQDRKSGAKKNKTPADNWSVVNTSSNVAVYHDNQW